MIELNAFFYDSNYYLLPAGVSDAGGLKKYIGKNGGDLHVRLLSKDSCFPPCFPDNSVRDCVLKDVDPDLIFPAKVCMMGRDEYDGLLKERVLGQCKNCHRYSGDENALDDYYCETPLLYDCPEKLTKKQFESTGSIKTGYEPVFSVDDFWNDFMQKSDCLIAMVNGGEIARAASAVSEMLYDAGFSEYLFPAISKFSYVDADGRSVGRFILMLTGGGFLCAGLVASYFAHMMPKALSKYWDVYPYVIRGLCSYWPGITELDVSSAPPMLRVTYLEQHDSFQVFVFAEWDREKAAELAQGEQPDDQLMTEEDVPGIVYCANYLYLCGIIGEDRLRGACLEIVMFPASELVYDGSTVTAEEFDKMIDLQIRDKTKLLPDRTMKEMELEGVAELRNVSYVETASDQLTFDMLLGGDNILGYVWDRDIATGTLRLETAPDAKMTDYIRRLLGKVLEEPGNAQIFDFCTGEDGTFFDMLVWDRFVTKRLIRSYAPVFRPYKASFILKLGKETEQFTV